MSMTLTPRTRRVLIVLTAVGALLAMFTMFTSLPTAATPDMNTSCAEQGYPYGVKIEDPSGTHIIDDGYLKATLTVGTYPDVASPNNDNAVLDYGYLPGNQAVVGMIIVKGGQNGYLTYAWGADTPLHAPANDNGKWPTLSHVDLCYQRSTVTTGSLLVMKVVEGDGPDGTTFTVTVTGPLPSTTTRSGTVSAGGTVLFERLVPGQYEIGEVDPGDGSTVIIEPDTVTVVAGQQATATVTNVYEPLPMFGSLQVSKVVVGPAPEGATYTIEVTGPAEDPVIHEVTVVAGKSVTLTQLIPGTYTVSEPSAGSGVMVTIDPAEVLVVGGETAHVTVTNTYAETPPPTDEVGSVSITKVVVGDAPADAEYEIVLTGPEPELTMHTVTLRAGQTVILTDLPVGRYTVTEPQPGEDVTVMMDHAVIDVTVDKVATVVVTNTYPDDEVLPPVNPEQPETPETPETPEALPTAGGGLALTMLATALALAGTSLVLVAKRPRRVIR